MKDVDKVTGYETSRDYELLARLMQSQSIVCIVDYDDCRDIAKTFFQETKLGGETWQVSVRGLCYIYVWNKDNFIKQCARINLEFIVPSKG